MVHRMYALLVRRQNAVAAALVATACAAGVFGLVGRAQNTQPVGTWAAAATVAPARPGAAVVTLADGRLLIAGGFGADHAATDGVTVFDPASNQATEAGRLLAARTGHSATVLRDGRVLVAGGSTASGLSSDIEVFDPSSGTSMLTAFLFTPRAHHASTMLADGTVLIAGGTTTDGIVVSSTEVFDPSTSTVSPAGAMRAGRRNASATTLIDGRVLVAGGNDGSQDLASAEMFDPWSGTFAPLDPASFLSVPRSGHTALLLPHNNSVLVTGGSSAGTTVDAVDLFLPTEFPDPYSYGVGHFVGAASMNEPRTGAVSSPAEDEGFALVMGGGTSSSETFRFATVRTDKDDYAPGERAVITGTGWQPGETVRLVLQEDPAVHADYVLNVVADAEGRIYWDQWAPELHDLDVRFYLTASDSRSRAQITFTDGFPQRVVLAPSSATVVAGQSALYTTDVTMGGTSNPCMIDLQVITPLPTGAAASFDSNPTTTTASFSRTLTITTTGTGPIAGQTPAGTYPFTVKAVKGTGCQANSGGNDQASGTLIVTAPSATSLAVAPAAGTFGGSVTLSATLTASGTGLAGKVVTFALNGATAGTGTTNAAGVATLPNAALSGIDAGSYPAGVTVSFAGDGSYAASTGSAALTVGKANASVTVNGYSGVYDGNPHGATGSATGVAGEDLSSLLTFGASFTDVPGGIASWSFAGNTNYHPTGGTASIVLTRADAIVSVSGFSGVYDGDPHGATGTATGVKGESLSHLLDLGASFVNVPGGSAHWTFQGDGNYNPSSGDAAIVLTKAGATVVVTGFTGVYDGQAHGASGSAIGVKNEDLSSLLSLGESFTDVPGGTASWSFAGNGNYESQSGTVGIVLDKANAAIEVEGFEGAYNGLAHGATGVVTGVRGEDLTSLLDLGASFTDVPGGTATWTFAGNTNYNADSGSVEIVISKADAEIDVDGYTGVYDGDSHGATGTATGVKGESLSHLLNLGDSFTNAPGGTASWTFAGNTNYNHATGVVSIAIAKANANITVTGYVGIYDGSAHGASGTASGVKGEDLGGLLDFGASFTNAPGGTASWSFAGNGNYNVASGTVAIVINKAPQVIGWADPAPIVYGTPLGAAQLNAAVTVGDGALTYQPAAGTVLPVGTQTLKAVAAETTNFLETSRTVTITVTPWHVTGFYNPVTMGGPAVVNTVKGGSTVPLKFNLYTSSGGTELTTITSVASFMVSPMSCSTGSYEDPVDITTTGGTSLRYDSVGGQFIQNWQTPKGAGRCYRVMMTALDGTAVTAYFKTK